MVGGGEVKVATVETVESVDNMATLPVSRAHGGGGGSDITPEKNNFTNKEMEAKKRPANFQPPPPKRYSYIFFKCSIFFVNASTYQSIKNNDEK